VGIVREDPGGGRDPGWACNCICKSRMYMKVTIYVYNACNSRSALTSHFKNILITKRGVLYTTLRLSCMGPDHRVHTEWQWPLSCVYSIMMEKSAQPDEGGRCTPTPFQSIYHHIYKVVVYAPAERADTLPVLLLYPCMFSVVSTIGVYSECHIA
jgi:hypothetical protein